MDLTNDEKKQREKELKWAAGKPHLLLYAERLLVKNSTVEGVVMLAGDMGKLQYELARFNDENELQELIDFFTVALKRHRRMELEKKAEIIAFKDRPKKGGD